MERSDGILIRLTKLTDTSWIVHWFTEEAGLIKTVAKGARRQKSSFAGKLDLFFSSEVHWSRARRGDLHALREAEPRQLRERIRCNYRSTLVASYFCRLLETAVEREHPEPALHDLLRRGLDHIDTSGPSVRALRHFETELARMLGLGHQSRHAAPALREALGGLPVQREQAVESLVDSDEKTPFLIVREAVGCMDTVMDSPTATLIQILRERVDSLLADGDYAEAVHAATAAVDKAQQALSADLENIDEFASTLEVRGELYRGLDRLEEARDDFKQVLEQLENRPDRNLQVARITASLGAVHDSLGHNDRAAELWEDAMKRFEENDPQARIDVAVMANNLAYLKKAEGDVDGAETHFLRALEILHQELGPDHEETATLSNNLGALYQAAGYHEQAREMHMMALDARNKLFGEPHPDTAQSHNNLALALLETGDRELAREHFEKALDVFQALGADYREDLEAVVSNFADFLRAEGEDALAGQVEERLGDAVGA